MKPSGDTPAGCKLFEGSYAKKMKKLIRKGLVPLSVSDIMKGRIAGKDPLFDYSICTGDAIIENPYTDTIKIVLDFGRLREITLDDWIIDGALVITPNKKKACEFYDSITVDKINVYEFKKDKLENYVSEPQQNPLWQMVARDQKLLEHYYVFALRTKAALTYREDIMRIVFNKANRALVKVRPITLGSVWMDDSRLDLTTNMLASISGVYHKNLVGLNPAEIKRTQSKCVVVWNKRNVKKDMTKHGDGRNASTCGRNLQDYAPLGLVAFGAGSEWD